MEVRQRERMTSLASERGHDYYLLITEFIK